MPYPALDTAFYYMWKRISDALREIVGSFRRAPDKTGLERVADVVNFLGNVLLHASEILALVGAAAESVDEQLRVMLLNSVGFHEASQPSCISLCILQYLRIFSYLHCEFYTNSMFILTQMVKIINKKHFKNLDSLVKV